MSDGSPAPGGRLARRLAVVTGAGSGIGAATAERLAAEGAIVMLLDTSTAGAEETQKRIDDAGGRASVFADDVADPDTWSALAEAVSDAHGGLDILVSNAATVRVAPSHELEPDEWDRQLAVNLRPLYLAFRAFHGRWQPGASAVAVSSVHAEAGLPGHPAYAASKGGLLSLVRQLAVEYGPDVRVNAVVPGPIMSPAWDRVAEPDRERSVRQTVLGRFGEPSEVASVVAFLASADAAYVTGTSVVVDGGWLITKDSA